jgi:predicted metal-dependent phosphoesterase TrpH
MIDLHTHTTASDGRCGASELVARAVAAGVTVLSVTDHDTVDACSEAAEACGAAGVTFVTGIEITAVREELDVHVLGYFFDPQAPALRVFLAEQRQRRLDRVGRMIALLEKCGLHLDADKIMRPAMERPGHSIGRPAIARALVAAGYVKTSNDAFAIWLSRGRPGFVAREGATLDAVIEQIHGAGGIASLAHPALLRRDDWLTGLAAAGLDAVEAYHTNHDEAATGRYLSFAQRLGLGVSGGSDYHADETHGSSHPGSVALPADCFAQLRERARSRATSSGAATSSSEITAE